MLVGNGFLQAAQNIIFSFFFDFPAAVKEDASEKEVTDARQGWTCIRKMMHD